MALRSIASLTLSFGLVSIPIKVFAATESKSSVSFNLMHKGCGSRLKQQSVCPTHHTTVERADMVKGYEFEKDKYVIFEPSELDALEANASHTVDIVSFMPKEAIDPVYFDKAYYLAPDKRGAKPYQLLMHAMDDTGTCALAKWVTKGKQHMVQVRAGDGGLVLQQLLYGDEVRSILALGIECPDIQAAELKLAEQLIEQYRVDGYDATAYKDEEKERILDAIDQKIAGKKITVAPEAQPVGGEVIDLLEALRASLQRKGLTSVRKSSARAAAAPQQLQPQPKQRKAVRRTAVSEAVPTPEKRTASRK
jgi:DNA end-binding protein Ku